MSSFKDSRERAAGGDSPEPSRDVGMFKHFPGLFECLFGYRLPNGENRPGIKVSLWGEQDRVKLCLNDENTSMVGFGVLPAAENLAKAIEELLTDGPIEWKPNKYTNKGGRK